MSGATGACKRTPRVRQQQGLRSVPVFTNGQRPGNSLDRPSGRYLPRWHGVPKCAETDRPCIQTS